jgi:hypothetical protein
MPWSVMITVSPEKEPSEDVLLSHAEVELDCCCPEKEVNSVSVPPGERAKTFNWPMLVPRARSGPKVAVTVVFESTETVPYLP